MINAHFSFGLAIPSVNPELEINSSVHMCASSGSLSILLACCAPSVHVLTPHVCDAATPYKSASESEPFSGGRTIHNALFA